MMKYVTSPVRWMVVTLLLATFFAAITTVATAQQTQATAPFSLRAPSVPLVVHDPYFSIWSPADTPTETETVHWTGRPHPLHAMVRLDGKTYRLLGTEPKDVPAMKMVEREIGPISTTYRFECEVAAVTLGFSTPMLPSDLELMSRPATIVGMVARSKDNKPRQVEFYFDAGGTIAVDQPNQSVCWKSLDVPGAETISLGTEEQAILGKRGDNVRIDWGYLLLSAKKIAGPGNSEPAPDKIHVVVDSGDSLRKSFVETGAIPQKTSFSEAKSPRADGVAIGYSCSFAKPETHTQASLILAYDDLYSIRYFEEDLRPWWKRDGKTAETMLTEVWELFPSAAIKTEKMDKFSAEFFQFESSFDDLTKVGGEDYAQLCALVYRQAMGAQKIVADSNGMPLMFSKENFSNGSIGTVDLMYPCGPLLLYYSPAMMKATLQPILDYGASPKWKFPFAPHDVGTYPHATGQTYGGGETSEANQMPVEESANMLILVAALAKAENNAEYARLHWPILTKWAEYLLEKGFDPENQLCTDDFAGHLAHNVNLSAKAIVGLGCYSQLAAALEKKDVAEKYGKVAKELADRWVREATEDDHTKLAFDRPGTWSMKYNLMWDELLGLNLFPREVIDRELAYYKKVTNKYGLPLDNRSTYSKNDWILWVATMTNTEEDFRSLVDPVIAYVNNTDRRVPLSDWYFTDTAKYRGFQARSVVGGFWAPMLKDTAAWQASAARGANITGTWAPLVMTEIAGVVVPSARSESRSESLSETANKPMWRYTFLKPATGWEQSDFSDTTWKEGPAGFGTQGTPGAILGTTWNTRDIWLRRSFELDSPVPAADELRLLVHHDEDVEIYINGQLVLQRQGYVSNYMPMKSESLAKALKTGQNTMAVYCRQTSGGQYIDVGIVKVKKMERK